MKTTGISTLDHAPQVVAEWLNALGGALNWSDKPRAYKLLRETLHALRDFLPPDEAVDLAAQLPVLVRGFYFDGWNPSATPAHPRGKQAFVERIGAKLSDLPPDELERAISAVFDLLRQKVSPGEIDQVAHALRKPLRELWQ
jgi:uncharacterized protein (DUF2267 family)